MLAVSIAVSLTQYVPIINVSSLEQGEIVLAHYKKIAPENIYSMVSGKHDVPHFDEYDWN